MTFHLLAKAPTAAFAASVRFFSDMALW